MKTVNLRYDGRDYDIGSIDDELTEIASKYEGSLTEIATAFGMRNLTFMFENEEKATLFIRVAVHRFYVMEWKTNKNSEVEATLKSDSKVEEALRSVGQINRQSFRTWRKQRKAQ